jgi:hypothetical protein
MRYRRFHLLLDVFGLIGIALAVSYYLIGHQLPDKDKDPELFSLWGNFATEIVGIWIGVRLIDYVIQSNEKKHSSRLHLVRNMRFLKRETSRAIEFFGSHEVGSLRFELDWAKDISIKRHHYLSKDEITDLNDFYDLIAELIPRLEKIANLKDSYYKNDETREFVDKERQYLKSTLDKVEEARRKAEFNILEETEEE